MGIIDNSNPPKSTLYIKLEVETVIKLKIDFVIPLYLYEQTFLKMCKICF